jgi:hypothetical protein
MDDYWLKEKKLLWLASNPLQEIKFEQITPDKIIIGLTLQTMILTH